jgi:transcriptional regulator with XRE-family HTH domain
MNGGGAKTFGTLLRRSRQAAALSQEALAARAGVSTDAVSTLERGKRSLPRLETAGLLADALGLAGEERRAFLAAARPAAGAPAREQAGGGDGAEPRPAPSSDGSAAPHERMAPAQNEPGVAPSVVERWPAAFGSLLRRYRGAAGLTQEALAEQARLSARAISDLERGLKHAPRPTTVYLLATDDHCLGDATALVGGCTARLANLGQ